MSGPTDQEITQAMIEVILDKACLDAQDEIHFATWRAGHGLNDCDISDAIIEATYKCLKTRYPELPGNIMEDFFDRIYTDGPSIEISAVLVINVGGRQFLISGSSTNGQDLNIVHEVEKIFDFKTPR
jgi:hypothetical protein